MRQQIISLIIVNVKAQLALFTYLKAKNIYYKIFFLQPNPGIDIKVNAC